MSSTEAIQAHLDRIAAVDGDVNAFLHVNTDEALAVAADVDKARAAGEELHALAGVPIAIKDLIVTVGQPTTAGSKMLEGWMSPYDATVIKKIRAARMPMLGKTNLDEFAMGSSTEHSAFGPTRNPWDLDRIPGGSGGGSAAAVSAFEAPLALGTDTGGSIRQPAAVTGTVGREADLRRGLPLRRHRHGVLAGPDRPGHPDRAGLCLLHELIGGHDPADSTSLTEPVPVPWSRPPRGRRHAGMRIGVIKELQGEGYQAGVQARFDESLELLRAAGAEIVEVSCPNFKYALGAYYLIMPSEASSNLAKFDGVRYGTGCCRKTAR